MALSDYLRPANSGQQMWQVLQGNMTSGDHPWNFVGICQALVSQWFVELRFANGRPPAELGRYLLKADLGTAGYNSIFKIQSNNMALNIQSGGTLTRQTGPGHSTPVDSGDTLGMILLSRLRGVDERQAQSLDDIQQQIDKNQGNEPSQFSCQLSINGTHGWLTSKVFGSTWGHAIGIHCNGACLFVFDPNAGVYTINPRNDVNVKGFCNDLWTSYAPNSGRVEPVH